MGCNCFKTTTVSPPIPKDCKDCFGAPSYLVSCNEGLIPCGGVGSVDTLEDFDSTLCDGPLTFSITDHSEELINVTIDSSGVISFETAEAYYRESLYTITYRIDCESKGVAAFGQISLCVQDLCAGVTCNEAQECEKCTGNCIDKVSDLSIGGGNTEVNKDIEGSSDLSITSGSSSDLSIEQN